MKRDWKMAKYKARLSFVAEVEIDEDDLERARMLAENMVEDRSVYEDDVIDKIHGEAYCAGGMGYDPPILGKKAYTLRDKNFEPSFAILDSRGKHIISCWKGTKE